MINYQIGDLIKYRYPRYGINLAIVHEIDEYTKLIGVMFLDFDELEWHYPNAIDRDFENLSRSE
jgi:hypothetical protein